MIYPELRDLWYLMPRQCARMISDTVVVGSIPWYAFFLAPKCFNQEMISTMLRWKMVWCDEHWVWHQYTRCDHEPTQKHSQHVITYSYTCEYLISLGQVKKGPSNNKKNWNTFFALNKYDLDRHWMNGSPWIDIEWTKHCQRHNGPEGWVHIKSSYTNLDQISSSESRTGVNFKISTKHEHFV